VLAPAVIRHALERLAEILGADGVEAQITVYGGASLAIAFLERGHVRIRVGSAATLLALKLRASRPGRDFEDIAVLVRACGLNTVAECEVLVNDFYLDDEEIPARGYQLLERAFGEVRVVNADPPFVLRAVTNHS
jgi:hypothetical protein